MACTNKDAYTTVIDCPYDESVHGVFEGEFEREHFKTKFRWDDFQLHSYQAIRRGENLLVVAPTSSGKTSVARYATLFNLLTKDPSMRVVYTTPIKSLSNEKYGEMKEVLAPYGIVPGLLTGDQKINIDSRFLIMTAEILSNALFILQRSDNEKQTNQYDLDREFVKSINCLIVDEIHFISDRSRGHIWENTLILLDPKVQIVGLSATIDSPEEFASWIGRIKTKTITLIKKYDRPVPLEYTIYDGEKLNTILDANGHYSGDVFQNALRTLKNEDKRHEKNRTNKVNALLNGFVKYAKEKELLQLCFIVFSKKNCEKYAETTSVHLTTAKESADAINELEKMMGIHLKSYENMPRYRQIKGLIQKGVCFHHAGIPVIMKEVIEHLFKMNHIKVLYATETVAIGVNMPIRTLVLSSVEKSVGTGIQSLNAAEFKQICGRAGRRGLDKKGLIVFLPLYDLPSELHIRNELLFGPMPKITSKMELTYHSYLKLRQSQVMDKNDFFDKSLLSIQNSKIFHTMTPEIESLKTQIVMLNISIDSYIVEKKIDVQTQTAIRDYLKLTSKQAETFNGFHIKPSKQQIIKQQKTAQIVKQHKPLYDLMGECDKTSTELSIIIEQQDIYRHYKDNRYQQIEDFLKTTGYVSNSGNIEEYGNMIVFINECNPFILVEIFTGNILQNMTHIQIVCLLSTLTDKTVSTNKVEVNLKNLNIDQIVKDGIKYIEDRIAMYINTEKRMGLESEDRYWELSYDYLEITNLWASIDLMKEDHSRILGMLYETGEYEGSFIKNILKINNIVGNLMTLCDVTQQLDVLPVLQEIERVLIKGMVNVDSLHVT
jgi:superfamily II RNA helicase